MQPPIHQAVILAGGRGTRLGSITSDTPKPLLRVGDEPFVDWLIVNLERQGVTDVILTIGYRANRFDEWLESRRGGPSISTFVEAEPLDTGGALTLLGDRLDERFFLLNGDTLFDVSLEHLANLLSPEVDMAIALRRVEDVRRYGGVTLDGQVIVDFSEKKGEGPGLINGGVYAMRRSVALGRPVPLSIERELIPELVAERRVTGLPCDGFFIDIGVPATLRAAQSSVPQWWAGKDSG